MPAAFTIYMLALVLAVSTLATATSLRVQRLPHRPTDRAHARPGSSVRLPGGVLNLGEYFVEIGVGTPPQPTRVQLDTGSSTLAIFDSACRTQDCGTHDLPSYQQHASRTAQNISCNFPSCMHTVPCDSVYGQCAFDIEYGDGSGARGSLATDMISIGPFAAPATFGRITNTTNQMDGPPFEGQLLNGIFGIAFESLNCLPSCMPTVLDAFVQRGQIDAVFGMCLTPTGGVWDVGVVDDSKFAPNQLAWLPILEDSYYSVPIAGGVLLIDSQVIKMPSVKGKPTIFDSGTTLLLGPSDWLAGFQAMFETDFPFLPNVTALITNDPTVCTEISANGIAQYPTIQFTFTTTTGGQATVNVPPQSYILQLEDDTNGTKTVCSVLGVGDSGGYGGFILGDVFLENLYAVYDIANRRVGFAPVTNCLHDYVPPTPAPSTPPVDPSAASVLSDFFSHDVLVVGAIGALMLAVAVGTYIAYRLMRNVRSAPLLTNGSVDEPDVTFFPTAAHQSPYRQMEERV